MATRHVLQALDELREEIKQRVAPKLHREIDELMGQFQAILLEELERQEPSFRRPKPRLSIPVGEPQPFSYNASGHQQPEATVPSGSTDPIVTSNTRDEKIPSTTRSLSQQWDEFIGWFGIGKGAKD